MVEFLINAYLRYGLAVKPEATQTFSNVPRLSEDVGNLLENVEHSWTMLNTDEKCVKLLNTVGQFWTQFTTLELQEFMTLRSFRF